VRPHDLTRLMLVVKELRLGQHHELFDARELPSINGEGVSSMPLAERMVLPEAYGILHNICLEGTAIKKILCYCIIMDINLYIMLR